MTLLAIDPGNTESAYAIYDAPSGALLEFQKIGNLQLLNRVSHALSSSTRWRNIDHLAIEMIASYGMAVGAEVFHTCLWIGRYIQAWSGSHSLVYRRDVKLHLCHDSRAKDGNVRQALIDRYGGKDAAIGKKATPGPLYGVSADSWSALAVAITASEAKWGDARS